MKKSRFTEEQIIGFMHPPETDQMTRNLTGKLASPDLLNQSGWLTAAGQQPEIIIKAKLELPETKLLTRAETRNRAQQPTPNHL